MKTEVNEMESPSFRINGPCYQVRAEDDKGEVHVAIFIGPNAKEYAEGCAANLSK